MTRKDYILIAAVLSERGCNIGQTPDYKMGYGAALTDVIFATAKMLAEDNERFDRARFLTACGVQA